MIDDSVPWKEELLKVADRLEARKARRRWTERSSFLVERDLMVSAYAIRKLMDAYKLSDQILVQAAQVTKHELTGRIPDVMNFHRPWDHYDLDSGVNVDLPLRELCNQVIHSFIFTICQTEAGGFDGVLVSSDKGRPKFVYYVDIETFVSLFRTIGDDDITETGWQRDNSGEMRRVYANNLTVQK
jgi:hypothetical protein